MTNNLALLHEIEKRCGGPAPDVEKFSEEWQLVPDIEDEKHIEMLLLLYFGRSEQSSASVVAWPVRVILSLYTPSAAVWVTAAY